MLNITNSAINYIYNLCIKKNNFYIKIIVFFKELKINFNMYFYNKKKINFYDYKIYDKDFKIFINIRYIEYIKNLLVDLKTYDSFNKQIVFIINNISFIKKKYYFLNKINIYIKYNINPILNKHNGSVKILSIDKNYNLFIKFYGDCIKCNLSKNIIDLIYENVIKIFPKINKIINVDNF